MRIGEICTVISVLLAYLGQGKTQESRVSLKWHHVKHIP